MKDLLNELLRLVRLKREALAKDLPDAEAYASSTFDAFEELLRLMPEPNEDMLGCGNDVCEFEIELDIVTYNLRTALRTSTRELT